MAVAIDPYSLEQAETDIANLRALVDRLSEVLTMNNITDAPNTPAAGTIAYTSGDQGKYVSADGGTYQTGEQRIQVSPHNQSITSTTPAQINNLAAKVEAGTYLVELHLVITWGAAAGTCSFQFNGPAISEYDIQSNSLQPGASAGNETKTQVAGTANGAGYNSSGFALTAAMTVSNIVFIVNMWAEFTFTAAGTLQAMAAEGTATDAWTVDYGYMLVKPVTSP